MFDHHFPIGRWATVHAGSLWPGFERGPIYGPAPTFVW